MHMADKYALKVLCCKFLFMIFIFLKDQKFCISEWRKYANQNCQGYALEISFFFYYITPKF